MIGKSFANSRYISEKPENAPIVTDHSTHVGT